MFDHVMINVSERDRSVIHLAFSADSRSRIEEFYRVALSAGGKSNGEPGIRREIGPNYYAAFVLDPDGNNIEAVCYKEE
jgi:predicted lactoylglutathione lyase